MTTAAAPAAAGKNVASWRSRSARIALSLAAISLEASVFAGRSQEPDPVPQRRMAQLDIFSTKGYQSLAPQGRTMKKSYVWIGIVVIIAVVSLYRRREGFDTSVVSQTQNGLYIFGGILGFFLLLAFVGLGYSVYKSGGSRLNKAVNWGGRNRSYTNDPQ